MADREVFTNEDGAVFDNSIPRFIPTARTVHVHRPKMSRYQSLTEKAESLQEAAAACARNGDDAMVDMWLWKARRLVETRNELTTFEATEDVRK
jgi:hypothetical protein